MSIILIIIGLAICSNQTPVHSSFGGLVIAAGVVWWLVNRGRRGRRTTPQDRRNTGTTNGVFDGDGNFVSQSYFVQDVDGTYLTPYGDRVKKGKDGKYHYCRVNKR